MKKNAMVRTYTTDKEEKEMMNSTMAGGTKLPGGGFHGGEQGRRQVKSERVGLFDSQQTVDNHGLLTAFVSGM